MNHENEIKYSGLSKRIFSFFIDIFVVIIANTIFTILIALIFKFTNKQLDINSFDVLSKIIVYCAVSTYLLYFSLFDSSLLNGTIGKRLLGIKVVGFNGEKLKLTRALARATVKYISMLIIIGFVPILFTKKSQALHDLILNTFVIMERR